MSTPEDHFIERVGNALTDCAELRDIVPPEWEDGVREQVRRNIAVAMGLIQHPGLPMSVEWNQQTLAWELLAGGSGDTETEKAATRLAAYSMLAMTFLGKLCELLDSDEAGVYRSRLAAGERQRLDTAAEALRAVAEAVGDDGVYPWL